MPFNKNDKRINKNGRPRGSKNKTTEVLRKSIALFLEDNFNEVITSWKKASARDKLNFYKDLLQYAIPKQRELHVEDLSIEQIDTLIDRLKNKLIDNELKG